MKNWGQDWMEINKPGSFVPLLQLQQAKGHKSEAQLLMAGIENDEDQASIRLDNMPRAQRELLQDALQMVMQPGGKARQGLPVNAQTAQLLSESVATLKAAHDASTKAHPVTVRHYLTDHLGTPIALVDANGQKAGQVAWAASYNAWGDIQKEYNPHNPHQPIRFQGQQLDLETGLHYNRFRYYDPAIGVYVTQDPLGLDGGAFNLFEYAFNTPTGAYDPTGLFVPLVVLGAMALGAAIGGGVEVGMQGGKQVLGQVKDNWDNGQPLTDVKWKCVDINWGHVGVSAGIGAIAPSLFTSAKTVYKSGQALKTLSGQAANTANRAVKLAARKGAHKKAIGDAAKVQAGWQGAKFGAKCAVGGEKDHCEDAQ